MTVGAIGHGVARDRHPFVPDGIRRNVVYLDRACRQRLGVLKEAASHFDALDRTPGVVSHRQIVPPLKSSHPTINSAFGRAAAIAGNVNSPTTAPSNFVIDASDRVNSRGCGMIGIGRASKSLPILNHDKGQV
jgi:hypothetical protein